MDILDRVVHVPQAPAGGCLRDLAADSQPALEEVFQLALAEGCQQDPVEASQLGQVAVSLPALGADFQMALIPGVVSLETDWPSELLATLATTQRTYRAMSVRAAAARRACNPRLAIFRNPSCQNQETEPSG